jgi:PEP-CTERM motif
MVNALTGLFLADTLVSTRVANISFSGEFEMVKRLVFAAILGMTATPSLAASVLYGSDEKNIYTVDTSTGVSTFVGANGLAGFDTDGYGSIVRDLTSSATTLYGAQWTSSRSGISGSVVTINAATGAITSTAALSGLLETSLNKGLYSIAYDASTNTLFGNTAQRLYAIDPVTGAAIFIGGLPTGRIVGLGVDGSTNALYAINQETDVSGAVTTSFFSLSKVNASVLSTVTLTNQCACDVAFDPLTNQGFVSSAFYDPSGNFLYSGLDALNGGLNSTSFVGQHGAASPFGLNGLAFFGVASVPEPQSWMLMIAGFGAVGFSMRRAKQAATRITVIG